MQHETDRLCASARQDLVVEHALAEHVAEPATLQCHDDVEGAAGGAAIGRRPVVALGLAQIDDVIVAAVAGEVELCLLYTSPSPRD